MRFFAKMVRGSVIFTARSAPASAGDSLLPAEIPAATEDCITQTEESGILGRTG